MWTEAPIFGAFPDWMSARARGRCVSGEMRRMDVVTVPVGNLSGLAIDPTVVDPAAPERLDSWLKTAEVACPLKVVEEAKREHYADTPRAWTLYPCGHGTQADMGPGAHECANVLARLVATRRNGSVPPPRSLLDAVRSEVYGRLGCSLMRELAQQVITTFSGSPRRGLTAENAYTHSMYRVSGASTSACICDPVEKKTSCKENKMLFRSSSTSQSTSWNT